ncbi:MAG: AMP-dependent synthetase, partial [Nitrospinaceae bacterium]|nr:AMP-dependent synthetase [Nitrospinaceae bacterium]NIR57391.1 AMP-dependent synthetase [Nitrospinaceae bacterium]NIS87843.1 AMP-dependent synthetase [Nitrospinaceae bacterium]NIT84714.1 AMP-dependent synthetase [Nitrospinaceae bacterium]NIU46892.1 AMP-dependent synthetase [Nitrospinaceae bacterium]
TEALPVTRISRTEILNETWAHSEKGKGYCVGKPVPDLSAKIIRVTDEALPAWDPADELPRGEIGEIVVQGPW